jgi:GT2 family glycosyltransferase
LRSAPGADSGHVYRAAVNGGRDVALPDSSAIICSRNRPRLLGDCVHSVLNGEAVPTELIIVDDSDVANDSLAKLTTERGCDIRYYSGQTSSLSAAQNFAIRNAGHNVLVFAQDDVEVDTSWLETLIRALVAEGPRTIVTGQVQPGDPEAPEGFVSAAKVATERVVYSSPTARDVLYAMNMAMYRAAAEDIGPFDERLGPGTPFPASEDSDFAYRALTAGYSIVYEPGAVVRHRAWRGHEKYVRLRWGYGVARGGFYAKHLSRNDRYILRRLLRDLYDHLAPLPLLAIRDRRAASGHLALAGGIVFGVARWLAMARGRDTRSAVQRESGDHPGQPTGR